jgi:hypothetical protein
MLPHASDRLSSWRGGEFRRRHLLPQKRRKTTWFVRSKTSYSSSLIRGNGLQRKVWNAG